MLDRVYCELKEKQSHITDILADWLCPMQKLMRSINRARYQKPNNKHQSNIIRQRILHQILIVPPYNIKDNGCRQTASYQRPQQKHIIILYFGQMPLIFSFYRQKPTDIIEKDVRSQSQWSIIRDY